MDVLAEVLECKRQGGIRKSVPQFMSSLGMKLHIVAADYVTLIDYIDTGFVLHEFVASHPFDAVIAILRQVRATPVHLAAPELLGSLAKNGVLNQLFGNQRRRHGQRPH
jgi:hypothetical protein